jgi:hypothetical protein
MLLEAKVVRVEVPRRHEIRFGGTMCSMSMTSGLLCLCAVHLASR